MQTMVGSAIVGGIIGGLVESIFSSPEPAAPAGPTPEEIAAQLQREEQQRREEVRRRQAFLRSKADLAGRLRGPGTTYVEDKTVATTGGLMLKSIPPATATTASSGDTHSGFFGRPGSVKPSVALLREPMDGAGEGLLSPDAYRKAVSNPNLTQEERERLQLRMKVAPVKLDDHPMADSRAFVEKERYSDLYLDLATAGAKAGASTITLSLVDEGGKCFLQAREFEAGFDEFTTLGKNMADRPQTTAGKVVAMGDFALTKAPTWAIAADGAVNAGGAITRQAFVRYWAARDSRQYYDPTPTKNAMEKWNAWYVDRNQWTKAALDRVGAGEFK
ncbi:MAG: hypothetical protein VB050_10980 [Geobacteraceae bacterium]|nr:hypothetical protein [Geobacteraceae bacterium]